MGRTSDSSTLIKEGRVTFREHNQLGEEGHNLGKLTQRRVKETKTK